MSAATTPRLRFPRPAVSRPHRAHAESSRRAWPGFGSAGILGVALGSLIFVCVVLVSAALALAVSAAPATAQGLRSDGATRPSTAPAPPEAGPARPRAPKDKHAQLESLFAALKAAPDARSAEMLADRLDQIVIESGSPTADLLMARAEAAAEAKNLDLALQILDQVITLEPDYIGALSKRATLLYARDDYGAALADIREVLVREPRYFPMLYGLALIMRDMGDDARALKAARRALAVNPHLDGAATLEKELEITVEGRPI